jgi:hypothetical protein
MPHYFFDIHNDIEATDPEGAELPDLDAARLRAIQGARALIAEHIIQTGRIVMGHSIEVRDENGETLLTIPFSEVLDIRS